MTNNILISFKQALVTYLMDHLKNISSNSDKNKMTTQSLATVFGPLFTCHYESDNLHKSIDVFRFLLDIWPSKNNLDNESHAVKR